MAFISELDEFLKKFDQQHPEKSETQTAHIKKHARIFKLRDNAPTDADHAAALQWTAPQTKSA